jgi:hypothetical protein
MSSKSAMARARNLASFRYVMRSPQFRAPGAEVIQRTLFVELASLISELARDPRRIGDLITDMFAGSSVLLMNLRKILARKSLGGAHQGWPQASMHIGDLAANESTDQHIRTVPHSTG